LPNKILHFTKDSYYIGKSPEQPQIGDLKLSFTAVLPEDISIIAKQPQLSPYETKIGGNVMLFEYGKLTSDRMFRNARFSLFIKNIQPRLNNFFLIFIGIYIIFNVLWIASPSLLNPNNFRVWLLALIIAITLTLAVISFIWYDYSPMINKLLLIISVGILYFLHYSYKPQALVHEIMVPQKKTIKYFE
jgi:hypothetical protein